MGGVSAGKAGDGGNARGCRNGEEILKSCGQLCLLSTFFIFPV